MRVRERSFEVTSIMHRLAPDVGQHTYSMSAELPKSRGDFLQLLAVERAGVLTFTGNCDRSAGRSFRPAGRSFHEAHAPAFGQDRSGAAYSPQGLDPDVVGSRCVRSRPSSFLA